MIYEIRARGASYTIDADPESLIGKKLAGGRPYEWMLLDHIWQQGFVGTAVDVGAHIGNHTLWLAVVCQLPVVAFEPIKHEELWANVRRNGDDLDVRVEPFALGAREGLAAAVGKGRLRMGDGNVQVRTLDSYELDEVALIKIDVEDMEPAVLRGALGTIETWRPVIFAEARDLGAHRRVAAVLNPLGYSRTVRFNTPTAVERWDP